MTNTLEEGKAEDGPKRRKVICSICQQEVEVIRAIKGTKGRFYCYYGECRGE